MKKRRGLTLIELLITMGLIGLVLIVITSVYLVGFRTFREELASSTVQSNAQTLLDAMVTDIKNGMYVEQSYDEYLTGPNSIIVRVPATNASKQILYNGADMVYDRVIYYYTGNEIHKIIFANPDSVRYAKHGVDTILDTNILALSFEYDPDQNTATLVTVNISSVIKVSNRDKQINLSGKARLRNHI
jgi:prepilin-type N-terminal cleavage/methylation domain-containing protein